ncbi:MAG: hypothetical protein HFH87_03365 [Lachnospiraceae bacterium]|nr:hypothetical protein [Lachnospiraceae bacterium]
MMQENRYFQKALSDFTHETASGGAIRHLTDMGYTVKQIMDRLDFPTPCERVQREVWDRLKEKGIILTEEPGHGERKEKVNYIQERDRFGRTSFRRVTEEVRSEMVNCWKELGVTITADGTWAEAAGGDEGTGRAIFGLLQEKVRENAEACSYASCDFGLMAAEASGQLRNMLSALEAKEREYVEGLPWEKRRIYHRMNSRMMEIVGQLCAAGKYQGECFFLKTEEKIVIKQEIPGTDIVESSSDGYGKPG